MFQMSAPSQIMLNDEVLLVEREDLDLGQGTIVIDGKRQKRCNTHFSVAANVQPMTGEELLQVPEGDRFDEQAWFYLADINEPLQVNDLVFRPGDCWYQVQTCEGWGSYSRCRAVQLNVQPPPPSRNLLLDNGIR